MPNVLPLIVPARLRRRRIGARPNPEDTRDKDVRALLGGDPDMSQDLPNLREWCPPVQDQATASSCVGEGHVAMIEIVERKALGIEERLSSYDAYWSGRALEGRTGIRDAGSYPRLVSKAIAKTGVCPLDKWPRRFLKVNRRPGFGAEMAGLKRAGGKFAYIIAKGDARFAPIIGALNEGFPVGFATMVTREFTRSSGPRFIEMPQPPFVGGHFMVIVGAMRLQDGRLGFITRNSWGQWRDHGYAVLTEEYIAAPITRDFTVFYGWPGVQHLLN